MEYIWMPGWGCSDGVLCVLATIGVWIAGLVALALGAMFGIKAVLRVGKRLFGRLPASVSGVGGDTQKLPTNRIMDEMQGPFKLSMLGFSMTAKGPVGKAMFITLLGSIPAAASLAVSSVWPPGADIGLQAGIPLVGDGVESMLDEAAGGNSSMPCVAGEPACAGR